MNETGNQSAKKKCRLILARMPINYSKINFCRMWITFDRLPNNNYHYSY